MLRDEIERRYGDRATIAYVDASNPQTREQHHATIEEIQDRGLIYPVTVVDGTLLYDGAVSYPAILRAIETRLTEIEVIQG